MSLEPVEIVDDIHRRLAALHPWTVAARHADLQRGGFGGNSIPEGSRSSEPALPVSQAVIERDATGAAIRWGRVGPLDAVDRDLRRRAGSYAKHLANALRELDAAFEEQGWFLNGAEATALMLGCSSCQRIK